jgi:hypothetical protein
MVFLDVMSPRNPKYPIHRAAAHAYRFVDVTGERAALIGSECGVFEAWIWPIKIGQELQPYFRTLGGSAIVRAEAAARSIEVTPHSLKVRYATERFTVDATFTVHATERVVMIAFEVKSAAAIEIGIEFRPEFCPMWPAGLGGQIVRTDDESQGLLLSEELGRFAAILASPDMSGQVAVDRGMPKDPIRLSAIISPDRARKGPVVFCLAGAEAEAELLDDRARTGAVAAATGVARLDRVVRQARALLQRSLANGIVDILAARDHEDAGWASQLMRIKVPSPDSPGKTVDLAQASAFAIKTAKVTVDGLGTGFVAGIGRSGAGQRPGFAWYFDGDAMIAGDALAALGDTKSARAVLERAASHQRDDGKLMHEMSLSAGLCRWFDDYPYAYYKCENTSAFLVYLSRYVAASGDHAFAETMRPCADRCVAWIVDKFDDEGFFDLRRAGLGAVEAGPLQPRLASEIYSQGFAVAALRAFKTLYLDDHGDTLDQTTALVNHIVKAEAAFERYWVESSGRYGFARLDDGEITDDLSAYLGLPIALAGGKKERAKATLLAMNSPDVAADWGLRMFARSSPIYDPLHYNTGSVFPYLNGFVVQAMYRAGFAEGGRHVLSGILRSVDLEGAGFCPEHLSGDLLIPPDRGVPHQIFSSSEVIHGLLRGLFGFDVDHTTREIRLRPTLPISWTECALENVRIGAARADFSLIHKDLGGTMYLGLDCSVKGDVGEKPFAVDFSPLLPPLSTITAMKIDGIDVKRPRVVARGFRTAPDWKFRTLRDGLRIDIEYVAGPSLEWPEPPFVLGSESSEPRVTHVAVDSSTVQWTISGKPGTVAAAEFFCQKDARLVGALRKGKNVIEVAFPEAEKVDRVDVVVRAELGPT